MKSRILQVALVLLLAAPELARATGPTVMLYQTNNVLTQRLGTEVAPFAKYIKDLEAAAEPFLGKDQLELLDIFVIVKPGDAGPFQRSRVWFVSSLPTKPSQKDLKKALEEVPPPEVTDGPVVFALSYALNGARPRDPKSENGKPPLPEEWKGQMGGSSEISDATLKNVWPD